MVLAVERGEPLEGPLQQCPGPRRLLGCPGAAGGRGVRAGADVAEQHDRVVGRARHRLGVVLAEAVPEVAEDPADQPQPLVPAALRGQVARQAHLHEQPLRGGALLAVLPVLEDVFQEFLRLGRPARPAQRPGQALGGVQHGR